MLAVAFYMLALSPKRAEVSELDEEVTSLETSISQQEQLVAFGEQARKEFPRDYGRMVVLGKAVPDQADSASLMVQLSAMAGDARRRVPRHHPERPGERGGHHHGARPCGPRTGRAGGGGGRRGRRRGGTTAPTPAARPPTATRRGAGGSGDRGGRGEPPDRGRRRDPPGFRRCPTHLTFKGGFFGIADYMGLVDDLVQFDGKGDQVKVNGRLMTVDGFALKGGRPGSDPDLDVNLILTSYATPSTQGLTAGATPGGPAPTGVPEATPASAVTP